MKKEMTIGRKFAVTSGALIAAMALTGVFAIYNLGRLNRITQQIVDDPLPGMATMSSAEASLLAIRGDIWRHIASADLSLKARIENHVETARETVNRSLAAYEKSIHKENDRELFNRLRLSVNRYLEVLPPIIATSRAGDAIEARRRYDETAAPLFDTAKELLQSAMKLNRGAGEDFAAESRQTYGDANASLAAVVALCGFVSAAAVFVFVRRINRSLRKRVEELSHGAAEIANAAAQVASSSEALARGSSDQAAAVEETSASTEEISSMAQRNTEHSHAAAALVLQAEERFRDVSGLLVETQSAMDTLASHSAKISHIVRVIEEIAFQTNILALNAAVEAARAGDAGMGFAVVADEVRNLAQRSAQSAKDTTALIEESIAGSAAGKRKVDEVAAAVRAIAAQSSQIRTLVDEVNLGSREQAQGLAQVARAVTQLEGAAQTGAATAEQGAAAAEQLQAQSRMLADVVGHLSALAGIEAEAHRHPAMAPKSLTLQSEAFAR